MPTRKLLRSQLVAVTIPTGFAANNFNFPDQPMLRNKRVTGIEIYTNGDVPYSPITGNVVATGAQVAATSFVAYMRDPVAEGDTGEYMYRFPAIGLHNMQNNVPDTFAQRIIELDHIFFQWEKCSLVFTNLGIPVAPTDFLFNIYYTSEIQRPVELHKKSMHGMTDGNLFDMLLSKIMMLEQKVTSLLSGRKE